MSRRRYMGERLRPDQIPQMLAATDDPRAGLRYVASDGYYDRNGYPVTEFGRPDWCSVCAHHEPEYQAEARDWRPSRVARWTLIAEDGSARTIVGALCEVHEKQEQARRDELRAGQEGKGRVA